MIELLEFLVQEAMPKIIDKQPFTKFLELEIGEKFKLSKQATTKPEVVALVHLTRMLPSHEQPPKIKLKPLLEHLKYAFLEANEKLLVIIT